jgi:hypothetical protein
MAEGSWIMRLRIMLAAAVMGLAVAGVTLARQQPGDSSQARVQGNGAVPAAPGNVPQLRAQVAELRAEVELGDIQHEVDKAMLSEMMKAVEQAQWKEASKPIQQADPNGGRTAEHPEALTVQKFRDGIGIVEVEVQHMKERYRARAVKLHAMKFALADLEERLANGWSR